jgi:ParB-like chromosome segregation protein Spo0J
MQTFEASLVENIQSKSLTPLEAADAFKTCVSDIIALVA